MSSKKVFLGYAFQIDQVRQSVEAACEGLADLACADNELTDLHLLDKIQRMMEQSDVCLFDLTSHNVNVAVEYGLARGLALRPIILYNESPDYRPKEAHPDVFSDLRGMDSIRYRSFDELRSVLRSNLPHLLNTHTRKLANERPQPRLNMRLEGRKLPNDTCFFTGTVANIGTAVANRVSCALVGYTSTTPVRQPLRIGTLAPGEPPREVSFRYDDLSMLRQTNGMEHVLVEFVDDHGRRYEQRGRLIPHRDVNGLYSYNFDGLLGTKQIERLSLPVAGFEEP